MGGCALKSNTPDEKTDGNKNIRGRCEALELYSFLNRKWTIPVLHCICKGHRAVNGNGCDKRRTGTGPAGFSAIDSKLGHIISPILLSGTIKRLVEFGLVEKVVIGQNTQYKPTKKAGEICERWGDWVKELMTIADLEESGKPPTKKKYLSECRGCPHKELLGCGHAARRVRDESGL